MKMKPKRRRLHESFRDAFVGIWDCIKMERNMRIHLTAAAWVIFFGVHMQLDSIAFCALIFAIVLVISAEMFNTAIEKLCDFNQRQFSTHIKVIKDVSAGAVLVTALGAVVIAVLVFARPDFLAVLRDLLQTPATCCGAVIAGVAGLLFIFAWPKQRDRSP